MNALHVRISKIAIVIFQYAIGFTYTPLQKIWGYTARIHLPPLSRSKRYIVAANHQSQLDPFAIFIPVSFKQRSKFIPMKFMTLPRVYHKWYVKPLAYLAGCYPAHIRERNHHTYGVSGTIKLLKQGYNICIFPEGRRTRQGETEPKNGIVRILQDYPDATLLLAHIQWSRGRFGGRKCTVIMAEAPKNLDKTDPKKIMNAIYAL